MQRRNLVKAILALVGGGPAAIDALARAPRGTHAFVGERVYPTWVKVHNRGEVTADTVLQMTKQIMQDDPQLRAAFARTFNRPAFTPLAQLVEHRIPNPKVDRSNRSRRVA